ncbi:MULTISPECIES: glucosamine-6-phosphate deaminase [Limnochorda]|uniref:glucosamine-6-phosphate deaminase n=1 Tax=Limnochorda TaxID=1676651 RepID=UPI0018505B67|nr:glucosamine-6-phosphate deaminase [Limnochorda pilosa]MBO2486153.1 glucosamine-6-phosphate deaminase [Bacillota bacterium]MBO2518562.1 glucosamine-6-phosphate deaminase [Bacillota bacterium]NMA70947.1 glucosamine-6-phosphate deaminase [Bacillota bacterium]
MQIRVVAQASSVAEGVAREVVRQLNKKPDTVLGLPTGATPEPLYQKLVEIYRRGQVSFAQVTTFNLDEYLGLGPDHPASYRAYMERHLFGHVDIDPSRIHIPDGLAPDPDRECQEYEEALRRAGYPDLQILGLGRNGHIGFNEPGTPFGSLTHRVRLTESTREANRRFFPPGEEPPTEAITMGVRSIMQARRILVLATGEAKAEAVAKAILGPVTEEVPASVLQLHPNVTWWLDEAAAHLLEPDLRWVDRSL